MILGWEFKIPENTREGSVVRTFDVLKGGEYPVNLIFNVSHKVEVMRSVVSVDKE
jgi:hypothetical protein